MAIDLNDKTANGNTLTNNGGTEYTADTPFAESTIAVNLELSESDYLAAVDSASLSFTGDFTIEAWVKIEQLPSTAGSRFIIVGKDNGSTERSYFFRLDHSGDKLRIAYFDTSTNQTAIDSDAAAVVGGDVGSWVHFAAAVDVSAKTAVLYKNASPIASSTTVSAAASVKDSTAEVAIGRRSTTEYLDGVVDEIKIFNDIRSSGEISDNYQQHMVGNEDGFVAYWPFESLVTATVGGNPMFFGGGVTVG